ncbi:hypothetical protein, partial [Azospirillum sp. B506]|uniref:hypothetical protein n=1 Tax=Azospirillum sp. B506 TaxID=137721 RepID=UPI0005B28C25
MAGLHGIAAGGEHGRRRDADDQRAILPRQHLDGAGATREFIVEVDLVAEIAAINPFDFFLEEKANHIPFAYDDWLQRELRPYLETEEPGPELAAYLKDFPRE